MSTTSRIATFALVLSALASSASLPSDFARRIEISPAANSLGSTTLTDFPVLVRLSTAITGFNYADFSLPNGGDLMFTDGFGTVLPHEVDTWNPNGESLVWVKVPTLTQGTILNVYYGNGATSGTTPSAVWSGYAGVWHLSEASGTAYDSTANGLDGTPSGSQAAAMVATAGVVGSARVNSSNKSYLSIPNYDSLALNGVFSASGWFKANSTSGYPRYFSRKTSHEQAHGWEMEGNNGSATAVTIRGANNKNITVTIPDITSAWMHVVLVYDDTTLYVYLNGTLASIAAIDNAADNGLPLSIGCNSSGGETAFDGQFDEIRLYGGTLDASQIAMEYAMETTPGFFTYSASTPTAVYSGDDPVVDSICVQSAAPDSLSFSFCIPYLGEGGAAWTVYADYGTSPDSLSHHTGALSSGSAAGYSSATLAPLSVGTTYYVRFRAVNDLGAEFDAPVQAFATAPATPQPDPTSSLPGVMQGAYSTPGTVQPSYNVRIADLDASAVDHTLGMLMARAECDNVTSASCHDDVSGNWGWTQDNLCFYYEGFIHLEGGVPLYVSTRFDDGGACFIDDVCVYTQGNQSGWNESGLYNGGVYTPSYTGWHPFRGYVWDWSGGKQKLWGVAAVQWSTNAAVVGSVLSNTSIDFDSSIISDPAYWHPFYDDGTGSFLRTALPSRSVVLMGYDVVQGVLSGTLSLGECWTSTPVYACYGETYGGDTLAGWDHVVQIGTAGTEACTLPFGAIPDAGDGTYFVRFAADWGDDISWSEPLSLVEVNAPGFAVDLSATDLDIGDGVRLHGTLSYAPVATTVSVEISRTGAFDDAVAWPVCTATGVTSLDVLVYTNDITSAAYIRPGTETWFRFRGETQDGLVSYSPVSSFTTDSDVSFGPMSAASSMWDASFSGSIVDFGAGDTTTVWLYVGDSPDSLSILGAPQVLNGSGSFTFPVTYPTVGNTVYYQFVASNACSTASWTSRSETAEFLLRDTTSYVWKNTVAAGDWEDADNWTRDNPDPRLGAPLSGSYVTFPTPAQDVDAYVVTMHSGYELAKLSLSTDADTTFIAANGTTGIGLPLPTEGQFAISSGAALRVDSGVTVTVWNADGANPALYEAVNGGVLNFVNGSWDIAPYTTYRAADGGQITSGGELWCQKNGIHLIADNGTFTLNRLVLQGIDGVTDLPVVTIAGENGAIRIVQKFSTLYGKVPGIIEFEIPANGFANTPIENTQWTDYFMGPWDGWGDQVGTNVRVLKSSPVFQGGSAKEILLVDFYRNGNGPGIATMTVDGETVPAVFFDFIPEESYFYFTDDGNGNLRQLWAHIKPFGPTVILFR